MKPLLQKIEDKIGDNDDFFILKEYIIDVPVVFLGFKSLIDLPKTLTSIQNKIGSILLTDKSFDQLMPWIGEVKANDSNEALSSIVEGKLIILKLEKNCRKYVIVEPVSQILNRSIESPTNENVLQGPSSSFMEDINTNIGMVRKQINSESLQIRSYSVGTNGKKKLSVLYFEGHVNMDLLHKISNHIERNQGKELNNVQDLSKMMGFSSWMTVSQFNTTELPQEASKSLANGRVVLFVDRIPFALVLPGLFWDMFTLENDKNYPFLITVSICSLRIIGVLTTLILPGLYVALVAVNPEVLRIELALSIAQSRDGVPYPALVEMILMLVILELIVEASVRLPKSIGPTITMVGGIILGQAVVDAKLVSNMLIIILAATTIANSTIVGFQNSLSIRLFKYLIVILASIYGVLGILAGIVLVSTYLAGISTFGIPYLYLNLTKEGIKNG
ncbi:spore germination protein [Bacillus sp. SD075]|uniref:spore germination protein n=1 Tax=Bacillus sp. SD075 TaxID=2781732 RepID=UPI001A95673D|nr:spore germination protein [Bacillus sp. SD075]MBO0999645.1 spore germination protein [Bacillus sp. SD075]